MSLGVSSSISSQGCCSSSALLGVTSALLGERRRCRGILYRHPARYLHGSAPSHPPPRDVLRQRLLRALLVVLVTLAVELALWYWFVARSYWRELFLPVAGVVALLGAIALWRALRPRSLFDRRYGDRRRSIRRFLP
jgi:hypothetical protein